MTLLPVGSEERDRRTILWLASVWQSQEYTLREWDKVLQRVEEEEVFKRYPKDNPAGSLESLVKNVIGISIQESKLRIEERTKSLAEVAKPAMKHGGDRKSEDRNQGDNYNLDKHRGTSSSYLASVIARDHPEIHEGMKDGKFKSTRQAAIAAGIIKPSQTWTAPTDIEKLAVAIGKRYSNKDILRLLPFLRSETFRSETDFGKSDG